MVVSTGDRTKAAVAALSVWQRRIPLDYAEKTVNSIRVAVIHSFYSESVPSGENVVVNAQVEALQSAGFEVRLIAARTDELSAAKLYKISTAFNVATGLGISPMQQIREFQPDIIHVHNLFPNFSTRWLDEWEGPLVATLHNFRPVCAAGTLFRDSSPCSLCPDRGSIHSVLNGCYKGSSVASIPLAVRNRGGISKDRLLTRADRILVLSERARSMYERAGIDSQRVQILENFVSGNGFQPERPAGNHWVYLGRLADEKGILSLMAHWPVDQQLLIYGDGPLRSRVAAESRKNIQYMGPVPRAEIPTILAKSRGLVFPSAWAEGAVPLTYIEALAAGRPVVASSGNAAADDIADNGTGLVLDSWTELGQALEAVRRDLPTFCSRARDHYDLNFGTAQWIENISDLYTNLIQSR
ncbi:glycosyltransferase family 4 protein [Paenarthrobacter aromaticivorans]|uniref:glycosyltransferase family 4 protein n=1 Tax=Paenarthrobacter aromaticivorans TaxID=2849150 RepID=UPI003A7FF036